MTDPGRLWLAYVEQASRSRRLLAELEQLKGSRSWRLTAPLRWLLMRLRPVAITRPVLAAPGQPDVTAWSRPELPAWFPAGLRRPADQSANLYVDVTQLALEDLGAGVQRVTRRVLHELMAAPPVGMNVMPVRLASDGRHYAANRFLESAYGLAGNCLGPEARIEPCAGDAYLGLDFCREHADALRAALAPMRAAGVPVALVVHDLLPLEHPDWFPTAVTRDFEAWLRLLAADADLALCISDVTRDALLHQLKVRGMVFSGEAVTFPLGADALHVFSAPGGRARPRQDGALRVLMVGTVEPRKGHAEVLDAFERLWAEGQDIQLVLAGRIGWQVDGLLKRLRGHPQLGASLHWVEDLDDAGLAQTYAGSDLLVMASHGEGYGLPVGEAATMGCRLLLRDLPVFREVAGDRARYFDSPAALLSAIRDFQNGGIEGWPRPNVPGWPTWAQSASALVEALKRSRACDEAVQ